MRFPRALMIRDDLGIEDCMKASQILEIIRSEKKRKSESADGSVYASERTWYTRLIGWCRPARKKRKAAAPKVSVRSLAEG
jgi:hypothetical protein